jgi:thiamine-monophosphate kinase
MPRENEFAWINLLTARFGRGAGSGIVLGIGDDAAILHPPSGRELVWTVDAQVEGVHFRRDWMTMGDIGWRSFVAAASDLFAMGAEPWCALSSLVVPVDLPDRELDALTIAQARAAEAVGCRIVGGNLSRGGELSVTTTLLGSAERPVRRDTARAGDSVWLAGDIGLAAIGLAAQRAGREDDDLVPGLAAFCLPVVRREAGRELGRRARAAIDLSDGLAQDAGHLATASVVAIVLDEPSLLASAHDVVRRGAACLGEPLLDLLLYGGEDYALLATSTEPLSGFTRIGDVEIGQGVWLRDASGNKREISPRGFDHFAG